MIARAVDEDDGVGVFRDAAADLGEVEIEGFRIGMRENQSRPDAARGAGGAEDVGPIITSIARRTRPRSAPRPYARQRALLTDAGLILEPDLERLGPGSDGKARANLSG